MPAPFTFPRPTVGRVVHVYTSDAAKHFNGQGAGPYPAIVIQVFGGQLGYESMANLKVMHWGGEYDAGSVLHKDQGSYGTYWVWPSREGQ